MSSAASAATVAAVLKLLQAAPEPMTTAQVGAAMGRTRDNVAKALAALLAAGSIRVAGHLPNRGAGKAGRPAPLYDTRVELGNVKFVPLPLPELRARTRANREADPVRKEAFLKQKREYEATYVRPSRNKPTPLPAFDPKTAINWKRAA